MSNKKTLVRFNVQNIKYAVQSGTENATPVAYGSAIKMALEANSAVKYIYGDGRRICSIINEKGKTGTMTTNNVSDEYEIAMKRKLRTATGLAEIKQQVQVAHAIYFETCGMDDAGGIPIAKTWLYGVTSSRPSESFDQSTDDINESSFDTPLEIDGTELLDADGKPYKDPTTGQVVRVWQMTVTPEDEGYENFGESVVLPRMGASAEAAESGTENGTEVV